MVSPDLVGAIQILTGLGALVFLKSTYENRGKPGSRGFGIFAVAVAAYALATGANLLTTSYQVSAALARVVVASGVLTGIAWLFLALEVTDVVTVTRRRLRLLATYLLLAWLVIWLDPGAVVLGPERELVGAQFEPDYQLGFWVLLGAGYAQILAGTGLFTVESLTSTGIRRRQAGLLALAILPALAASVVNAAVQAGGTLPYDYTVFGWAGTLVVFAVALYSGRFLDISALARRVAMGNMPDAMVILDDQNRVVDYNAAARESLRIDDEAIGMPAAACFEGVEPDPLSGLDEASATDREVAVGEGDEQRHFAVSKTTISDTAGQGTVLVFHDVTAQKRREAQLARQNERLERFAEVVSHDLRNPLSLASGHVDLAEETGDAAHFETARDAHDRMESMIDDLLTLARAGQAVEETEPVDVSAVVRQAWETVRANDCTVVLDVPDGLTIRADDNRLLRLFENLFRNAIEHNDHPVTVRVGTLTQGNTETNSAGLFIEDDGRGLPVADSEALFEHGYTTTEDGTGLGLSIVHDIAAAHDWSLRVTEGETGGARFELTGLETVPN